MRETVTADKIKETAQNNTNDMQHIFEERISKTMVGRSLQIEMFKKQFGYVLEGGMGLTIVSGHPGIGKSFFVERASNLFTTGNITYVYGKFRQYDKSPLIAFSEVIEQIVRHILTLPAEALKNIKNDLYKRLGTDAKLILSVCPYAGILLGTNKAVNTGNLEQLKYRVRKAVYQFLAAVSTALFPMIVFIDDLQWADTLSINIIETICQDYGFLNLHLVLAWRDSESGEVYLNPAKLPEGGDILIELGELKPQDIDQYIRLVFEQDIEQKDYLIRILYGLTLGNPFNIVRVLRLFIQENVLTYSTASKKWLVRLDKMEKLNLPADTRQLLTRQIDSLKKEDKELLSVIACCGDVTFLLLKILTGIEDALLNTGLDSLCKNSLLVKVIQEEEVRYCFAHPIVLELAYSNLEASLKSGIHYHIAETLTKLNSGTSVADGRLDIAKHLLRVDISLLKEDRTGKWTQALYQAGVAAKQGAAAEQALEIFQRCAELLSFLSPDGKNSFDLNVRLELSECRFICGQAEEAEQSFKELIEKYPETENLIKIKRKYMSLCACSCDLEKVMELGDQILAHLNFNFDRKHIVPGLIESILLLTNKKISRLITAPDITDKRLLYILETLTLMTLAANRIDDKLSEIFALRLAVLSARHGNSDYAPIAYAAYCYALFSVLRDPEKGKRMEKSVLALIEKCENADSKSAAWFVLGAFSLHLTNTLEDTVDCLKKSVAEVEKSGSSLFGGYAAAFVLITKYMMGTPLEGLRKTIDDYRRMPERPEHYIPLYFCDLYANHIRRLEDGFLPEEAMPLKGEWGEGKNNLFILTVKLTGDIIELRHLYLESKIKEAYELTVGLSSVMTSFQGFILDVEFIFYSILTRLAMHRDLPGKKQRSNHIIVKKLLKELKYCVDIFKDNHYAKYLLAQAEYDALFKPEKATDKRYQEAMDFSERQGNLSLEALANLLAAKFHRDNPKLRGFYANEAIRLYKKWGADYIGNLIAGNLGLSDETACSLDMPAAHPDTDIAGNNIKTDWDILFHLGEIEKMSEDEGYLYLLDLLIRHEDADYCAVFFKKSDEIHLKYDKRKEHNALVHQDLINMNHLSGLPHKIIRYVARTETEILLDGKTPGGVFANDPYLSDKDGLSLLCLPIKNSGVLIGIIYMEKTGGSRFDDGLPAFMRVLFLPLLSRQTTIKETNIQSILNPPNENSLFTERELEVLKAVARGLSNVEISGELHITPGTVKNYLSIIYSKLEVDNRVKALKRAKELKII